MIGITVGLLVFSHLLVGLITRAVVRRRCEADRIRHADRLLQSMPPRQ